MFALQQAAKIKRVKYFLKCVDKVNNERKMTIVG